MVTGYNFIKRETAADIFSFGFWDKLDLFIRHLQKAASQNRNQIPFN